MNLELPKNGICVDASTRGNPGISQYKIVDLSTGKTVVISKKFYSTNNIAEFIGLCHAIHYCLQNGDDNLFCDSITAISWVKNKLINSNMARNSQTSNAWQMTGRSMNFVKSLNFDNYNNSIQNEENNIVFLHKWLTSE